MITTVSGIWRIIASTAMTRLFSTRPLTALGAIPQSEQKLWHESHEILRCISSFHWDS